MVKFKQSKEFWKDVLQILNPQTLEDFAIKSIKENDMEKAAMLLSMAKIGVKILNATFKSKSTISISFSFQDAVSLLLFIGRLSGNEYIKNTVLQMNNQLHKEMINYKPIYK